MQETIEAEHLREAYDENELPKLGTVRANPREETNDETEISFNVGDVIERQNTVGEDIAVEFRYVLELYRRSRRLPRGLTPGLKPTALLCLRQYDSVWDRWNVIQNCDNGVSSRSQKKSETVLIWKKATN